MGIVGEFGIVFARKWIAGTRLDDAVKAAKDTNMHGYYVMLNYLGEHLAENDEVEATIGKYAELLGSMKREKIKGSISVKLTQLGLSISPRLAERNFILVAGRARSAGVFTWIDAEEAEYAETAKRIYLKSLKQRLNAGICIQANLKRGFDDAKEISKAKGVIRLVKGAYTEKESVAFASREEATENYARIMEYLFENSNDTLIATHDDKLIHRALELERKYGKKVSFAMLRGIRGRLANELLEKGESVSIYIPFGEKWMDYSIRRLKEAGHAALLLRSIFQQ